MLKNKKALSLALAVISMFLYSRALGYAVSGADINGMNGKPVKKICVSLPYLLTLDNAQIEDIFKSLKGLDIGMANIFVSYCGGKPYAFQPEPGKYSAEEFDRLDFAVAEAQKAGVSLMLTLSDSNPDYGGIEAYRLWTGGSINEVFFKDKISREYFKKFIDQFQKRKNSVTGKLYKNDPAIFCWNLCNEADGSRDWPAFYAWAQEMASYIKKSDKARLVTVNIKEPASGANPAEDFEVCLLLDVDFVFYSGRAGASNTEISAYNKAYYENVNKPIAACTAGAGITDTAKAFFDAEGSLLFFNAGFGSYRAAGGMCDLEDKANIAAIKIASETALAASKPIPLASSGVVKVNPGTENTEITVIAPGNSVAEIMYGQSFPLKNSTGPKQVTALAKTDFLIEGLTADNEYIFYTKIKTNDRAYVSKPAVFRTAAYKPLIAIPFHMSGNFIKVKGASFYDGKDVFKYVGTNCYYMRHDDRGRPLVDKIFSEAAKAGFKVIRVGSNGEAVDLQSIDPAGKNRFFRIGPDYFNEEAYKGLDYVLDSAARHGIRVILHFTDNWEYYGGAKVYVKWAGLSNKNLFWVDPKVKGYYKQTIDKIVNRKNTVNGKLYKNDPVIFAYDLLNEPRDEDDVTGKTLASWVAEMSEYVKSQDPNHMVTTGMEGFFLKSDGTHYSGADFVMCQKPASIDYAVFHIYPASEYNNYSMSTTKWMIEKFIKTGHEELKKPVVMEEYGIPRNMPEFPKAKWIDFMTGVFFAAGGDGVNYWMFSDNDYHYGDINEVKPSQTDCINAFIKYANIVNK